ncbi:polysaccharide deacetylase [Caldicellulosiruptor acetigenus 6A]|uniref:Polysaccharide deacetylase n=2 Tax=Caldicellulosiruptor acetigenus TaxID=301953 RepID=G2PZ53_9FIRM|nr:polysaccharide deacetylase family protein [Caldicellulosiruptor acetigenus]AEM74098.1 polysaccharide deacetylase [Caldicellulosiruptor acetigenus 6A]
MSVKKIMYVASSIIVGLIIFFASMHISKNFFSAIILKQNYTYLQEERLKNFEKPKLSQNQKLVKTNLNENDKAKNTVDTQNKDAQAEKQAKNEKIVYLTIDDGPSPVTSSILEILEKEKVKATFFVVGINCIKYPQYLKEIYQKGHLIGNHSYSHRYKSIYKDFNHFVEDFKKAQDTIYKIIGTKPKYYRFPGGSLSRVSPQIKKFLDANGIVYVDWNAITGDSTKNHENLTPNQILKITISTANKKNEVVLLMHDSSSKKNVIEALPSIIRAFKKQGYRFETIDKMQKPLQFKTKAASH